MKIAYDASFAAVSMPDGKPQHVLHLVKQFENYSDHNFTIFFKSAQPIIHKEKSNVQWKGLRSPTNHALVWSQFRLPIALLCGSFDITHIPAQRVPWIFKGKLITTIHDFAFLHQPDALKDHRRIRDAYYTSLSINRSTHFTAVSQFTKDKLCEAYHVAPDKVDVVHPGIDPDIFRADVPPFRREKPYILTVGTLQPYKNQAMLIRAFNLLCKRWKEPIELLIVGQRGWYWEPIVEEAQNSPYSDRIHFMNYVKETDLPSLYKSATLYAAPSYYEGFGVTPLESMACGTPVLAADIPPSREVVGDAGILINPHDIEAWTDTMLNLLENPTVRNQLKDKGLARAQGFTWRETVRKLVTLYEKVHRFE